MTAQYQHPDGEESPQFIGVYREFKIRVDDDGTYETDVDPDVLREHGFLADGDNDKITEDIPDDAMESLTDADVDPDEVASEIEVAAVENVEEHIENGVCPFCDDYEGEGVPQHASSAHPDAWDSYKGAE